MKLFKTITSITISAILIVFALNILYLATLYQSIEHDVRRDVHSAMLDMDVDELWLRTLANTKGKDAQTLYLVDVAQYNRDSLARLDSRISENIIDVNNATGNYIIREMSRQMHSDMDIRSKINLNVIDSLLRTHLAARKINPEYVHVEICDTLGNILVDNPGVKTRDGFDTFDLPLNGFIYRAYLSPLTEQVFNKMRGIIITTFILVLLFATGFWYLLHSIRRMRTIEEMKDDFINNMTHELKTPIAVAYAANDSMLNFDAANDEEKRVSYLNIAMKQLRRLQELVEGILSMSMERRKSMKLNIEDFDLLPLVNEVVASQRLRQEKPVRISVTGQDSLKVRADKTHFINVLNTLIDNSIKYSGDSVDIQITCTNNLMTISDNGIGIPSKSLPYIFDRFYRVPHDNVQNVRGYGIGLYYARQILGKIGYTIKAESKEGRSTTFTIKLSSHEE